MKHGSFLGPSLGEGARPVKPALDEGARSVEGLRLVMERATWFGSALGDGVKPLSSVGAW